jgi:hypothetical protein
MVSTVKKRKNFQNQNRATVYLFILFFLPKNMEFSLPTKKIHIKMPIYFIIIFM